MGASVRLESALFSDVRFDLLAEAAGYVNRFEAIGRMAYLWHYCTERQAHTVSELIVKAHLGPSGAVAIVQSELGEVVPDGIRIKGTEGRIEWLGKMREASKKGGEARKASISKSLKASLKASPPITTPSPTTTPTETNSNRLAVAPAVNGAPRQVSGPDGEFLRHFDLALQKTHGTPYMAAMARDRKISREIIAVYGLPLACEMVDAFFAEAKRPGSWIGKAKPDLPGFLAQIPNLIRDYRFDNKAPTLGAELPATTPVAGAGRGDLSAGGSDYGG